MIMFVQIARIPLPATPLDQESRNSCLTRVGRAANPEDVREVVVEVRSIGCFGHQASAFYVLSYSFVIVSSRLSSARATTVQAAASSIRAPLGSGKGLSGFSDTKFHGFSSPAMNRSLCRLSSPSNSADSSRSGGLESASRKA